MESSGKGYAIYEQNYVALLQGSKMSAGLRKFDIRFPIF